MLPEPLPKTVNISLHINSVYHLTIFWHFKRFLEEFLVINTPVLALCSHCSFLPAFSAPSVTQSHCVCVQELNTAFLAALPYLLYTVPLIPPSLPTPSFHL